MGSDANEIRGWTRNAMLKSAFAALMIGVGSQVLSGCGPSSPKAGRYNIVVHAETANADQTYDVDIFGVESESGYAGWGSNDVAAHFGGGQNADARRDRSPFTMHWDAGDSEAKYLRIDDPIWDEWIGRGDWYLVVASNREFVSGNRRQYDDPIIIPLDKRRWKTKQIEIDVKNSELRLRTRMEPPPQP